MNRAIKQKSDGRLPLAEALRQLKAKYPWAPIAVMRKAVADGKVPAVRSSLVPRARYYVQFDDLEKQLLSIQQGIE